MAAKQSARWITLFLLVFTIETAWAGTTTITWHGHAAFQITTPNGKVLMIDPWLNNPVNPNSGEGKDALASIQKTDYILVTHGHFDHVADAASLGEKTGARLVATFELGTNLAKLLGYPKKQMGFDTLMNIGGEISIAEGEVTVAMTPAVHSSGVKNPKATDKDPDLVYGGNPVGFVITIQGGPTIYHTGDTAFFKDMEVIGEFYTPDLALINIGGHFGMEPRMAAEAAKAVRAKIVVPHHYGTFPVLTKDPKPFVDLLKKERIGTLVMKPGSTVVFEGKKLKP